MSKYENNGISRRGFIAAVGAASLVSGAAGARIASQNAKSSPAVITVAPEPDFSEAQFQRPTAEPVITNPAELIQANDQITKLTAENGRLQAENSELQQELDKLKASLNGQTDQVAELETKLAGAVQQGTVAMGLVALYEKLEEIEIAESFEAGISAVGEAWDDFIGDVPDASVRLEKVKGLISSFDDQIPTFQTARNWLAVRLELMRRDNNLLQEVLENLSETAGSILEMLSNWFDEVRSWLPARFLVTANNVIDSLLTMVASLPVTIDGAQENVVAALDGWFRDDAEEPDIPIVRSKLFNPLKDELIPEALTLMRKTRIAKQKYEANLVTQVSAKFSQRQEIESQISEYRKQNDLQKA